MGEFRVIGGVTLAGEEAGEGDAGRAPARPDRDAPLRRHGLARARARRAPRGRLRRARPRRVLAGARRRTPTATSASPRDLLAVLDDRGIDRAVLAGASMGAHTVVAVRARARRPRGGRSSSITPAFDPSGAERGLERWDALSRGPARGRGGGLRRGLRRPARARAVARDGRHGAAPAPGRARAPRGGRRRAARGPALAAVRGLGRARASSTLPAVVVASRDEADPEHPYAVGERYAEAIPGARAGLRGAGQLAAGLAGRPALAGHRRGRGANLNFNCALRGAREPPRVANCVPLGPVSEPNRT